MKTRSITGNIFLLMLILIFSSCDVVSNSNRSDDIAWDDFGELIPASDEQLSDEQRSAYRTDAEKLAVRKINEEDSTQTEVPQKLVDLFYNGLVHIALSDNLKAEEPTETYEVHVRMPVNPREITVEADTTAEWIDAWRNGETETGNEELDELIDRFNFNLIKYRELKHVLPIAIATLRSDRVINGYAVGRIFGKHDDIEGAGNDFLTDGSDIRVLFFEDHLRYTFDFGFGDCLSGCINRHSWQFDVARDGSVSFVGEEGDPLPGN